MKNRLVLLPKILAVAVIVYLLWLVLKDIDWAEVWQSLARLTLAQILIILALVLVRQLLNAVPMAMFVAGLDLKRSTVNDLSANLIATTTPPPGDVIIRFSMFRTWKIDAEDGMAGRCPSRLETKQRCHGIHPRTRT
ncbi:MAG: flippase-like domain-containing protein [Actinomycetia bacterium]|nr:flippase-like domain-containing protein [Actinomycetes bacterium]